MNWSSVGQQLELLPNYLGHHLLLTVLALAAGIIICVPLGALVTRIKSLQWPTLTIAGILQTIPGIALLALMVPLLGTIGFLPALIALTIYSFLPILRNTVTGILGVDPSVIEAARGIGMTDMQLLFRVEMPLALPVLVAGIRTATVWVVGTATLATPVGATSLGNFIFSGLQTQNLSAVTIGAVAAAVLAVVLDQLVRLIEVAASRRSFRLGITAAASLVVLIGFGLAPVIVGGPGTSRTEKVVIGSKPFTEQYILAQLIADVARQAGFSAQNRSGMGSIILFEATANGSVDCYVDYSGTVWTNVMHREDFPPREKMLAEMKAWLKEKHNIELLGALGFENTYALAVRKETAEKYGLVTIGDLAAVTPELSIGSDYEFFSRPEWQALKNKYDLNFAEQRTLDPTLMYSAVEQKQVDVISAYSTDGRIAAYDLVVLKDPQRALPPYDAILLLSSQAADRPRLVGQLRSLIGSISDSTMRQANKLVDVDGQSVDSAAAALFNRL
jgi:osmoprotectant transport system permease protein